MGECHIFTKVGKCFILLGAWLYAQEPRKLLVGPDSIPIYVLPPVEIIAQAPSPEKIAETRKQWAAFQRLRYNVHLVYPLAKEAARIVREVDNERARLGKKNRDYKAYSRRLKKELFEKYEPIVREMTVTQGILLIKLIHRETGVDAYALIRDYLGGLQATFWQGVAKLYGSDLKLTYDPAREPLVEAIIEEIETGRSADWVLQMYEIPPE
ncbi:MAG: DUF4294 domain-containing protein [Bacteroidia bacterium]|nr:DUF4294 domain-containing protein [Bacteroidia bacterium]GIV23517.1 MAG: hypothetical protein KatS3mg025_1176 [Bacteroidia bacterium]